MKKISYSNKNILTSGPQKEILLPYPVFLLVLCMDIQKSQAKESPLAVHTLYRTGTTKGEGLGGGG